MNLKAFLKALRHGAGLLYEIIPASIGYSQPGTSLTHRIIMRINITALIVFSALLQSSAAGFAQKISLHAKNVPVEQVLKSIERQTEYVFFYDNADFQNKNVSINVKNASISETLNEFFKELKLDFKIINKTVIVQRKEVLLNDDIVVVEPIDIVGIIIDDKGEALPGASIKIKGLNKTAMTDAKGKFLIRAVDANAVLVVSFVGFVTQEIAVNERTDLVITLQEDKALLKDVVVVGYGTQKKINVTGSVETVSSKMIENRPTADVSNLLAGQVPGLTVIQNSGQPGKDQGTLRIRGIGTLGSGNDPLIIVDGIESTLFNIDANDIENISVLKDASTSAIYGVRAANGVIIVTTKRGKAGQSNISYNNYFGFQSATRLPKFLNSADYAVLYNEALVNDGGTARYTDLEIQKYRDGSDPINYPNSDWVSGLFSENGFQQNHHLSFNGGTETSKYALSLGYLDRGGLIPNTSSDRYSLRINFDQDFSKRFKMSFNLSGSRIRSVEPVTSIANLVHMAYREAPVVPIQYAPGIWSAYTNEHNSSAQAREGGNTTDINSKIIATINGQYELLKGLKLKGVAAVTNQAVKVNYITKSLLLYNAFDETTQSYPLARSYRSMVNTNRSETLEVNLQSFLDYEYSFNKAHNIKALLGYNQISTAIDWMGAGIADIAGNNLDQLDAGNSDTETNYGSASDYSLRSYFGRFNYNYKEKYLLEANLRYDGTSRFPATNRWGWFPSFSAGWRISEEGFFPDANWIQAVKLRGSWGQLGNQEIGNYGFLSTYVLGINYSFNGQLFPGIAEKGTVPGTSLYNKHIKWETTTITNLGVDADFFEGKLSFTGEYFVRNTDNILLAMDQPSILGVFGNPTVNAGAVSNKGFDLVARHKHQVGKLGYYINANISYVKNKITDLGGSDGPGRSIGDPIQNIYGYVATGIFQTQEEVYNAPSQSALGGAVPGDIRYEDLNGDYVIDAKDRKSLGSPFPQINYGFQLGGNIKNFDISVSAQGVGKVHGLLSGQAIHPFLTGAKALEMHLDRWTPENPDATYPRISLAAASRNTVANSFFMQSTSYLRIRNIQLGYSFPPAVLKYLKAERVRLYFSADNPFLFTKFKGFDPEAPMGAANYYPQVLTVTGGINITF